MSYSILHTTPVLSGSRTANHHLTLAEGLGLLDAHRQAYRIAFSSGDMDTACIEADLINSLLTTMRAFKDGI